MTRDDILRGLRRLDELLKERGMSETLYIAGGAALSLDEVRLQTHLTEDVDILLRDHSPHLFDLLTQAGKDASLPDGWLDFRINRPVKTFDILRMDKLLYRSPNLTVFGASDEYQLALKVRSARIKDEADVRALMERLGLRTAAEARAVHDRIFPESPLDPIEFHQLEGWLDKGSLQSKDENDAT